MSSQTSKNDDLFERIHGFVMAGATDELDECRLIEFERLLDASDDACRAYAEYMHASMLLPSILQGIHEDEPAVPEPVLPTILGYFAAPYHGAIGFFSQEVPFSILIATLIFGLAGLIGSMMTVQHYEQLAGRSPTAADRPFNSSEKAPKSLLPKEMEFVGRITGMVDCKWSDDKNYLPPGGDYVALGRKYKLDSGLIEITYNTGAKVILQGPVAYEVESANGGYMSVGKLTGKVEVEKAKGFFVRTPTAVVTDLGTEFGVEVDKSNVTTSQVFQGKVAMRVATSGKAAASEMLLAEGESAQIGSNGRVTRSSVSKATAASNPIGFVRAMPKLQTVHVLNPSFEEPVVAIGEALYFDKIPNSVWKKTGNGGAGIQSIQGTMPWEPDGGQAVFIDWKSSGTIYQILDARVGDYSTLFLTAYAGIRLDEDGEPNVEVAVQLYAAESGKLLGETRQRTSQKGMWHRMQFTCRMPPDVPRKDHLKIVLRRTDGGHQVLFDDIKLLGQSQPHNDSKGG